MEKEYKHEMPYTDAWKKMTGPIPIKMTSDYLFRILLQRDEQTLKALIAALLKLDVSEITDIVVTNPIAIGDAVSDKEYHLDVHVTLNGDSIINIEMQVSRRENWAIRTVLYACRALDQLSHGEDYFEAGSVIQVAFTDFTLFEDEPEFFSKFQLLNVKHPKQIYCDKLTILNVDLTNIGLASSDDKQCNLDKWASVFKTQTWEDMKMLAAQDQNIDQAASSVWQLMQDFEVREQIRRREANERYFNKVKEKADKADALERALKEKDSRIEEQNHKISALEKELHELKSQLDRK